ncbi:hypothetical protein [Hyphococcus sp.]|uniref:hypothetical protein n=1 Tax=Hyphococcus sp. TaxID=2038636 RepID=UPI0035C67398
MYEKEEMSVAPNRKSFRFDYAAPIDIVRELERQSFGAVINVSRGGKITPKPMLVRKKFVPM